MTLKTTKLRDAITFALVVSTAGTGAALAQETEQREATTLDRIEVTGSRIRQVDAETSSPVLSIDRQQLEQTGLTSVGDVLFNITSSDGGALRNITTSTNGSDGTQNISLRGLGATRTLVLVNGRRWVTQGDGTVDLNTIPISVVERIEVLKDGASAVYGSDAIAGVVNVITRTNFEGAEARAYIGQYAEGDGFQEAYDFTLGANTDKVNAVISLSYTDQDEVFAADRTIASTPVHGAGDLESGGAFGSGFPLRGNFGRCRGTLELKPTGFSDCTDFNGDGRLTGADRFPGFTLERGADGRDLSDFRPFVSYTTDGSGSSDRYNFAPINYILQPIERFNIYGQGTLRLTDSINANMMATYVKRRSTQQLAEVPLSMNVNGTQGPQWAFAPTAGNVFNPFGVDLSSAGFRMQAGGPRKPTYDSDNIAVTTWFDGAFEAFGRNMYWDAGYSYLEYKSNQRGTGYVNLFNLRQALGDSRRNPTTGALECLDAGGSVIRGCVPFNIFGGADLGLGAGVITQDEYDAMLRYVTYTQVATQGNTTKDYFANLTGDLFDLPAGPLGFAVGVEHRRNSFFNQPDALVAGGGSSDNFTEATTGNVNSDEIYAELNIPVLGDLPFAKLLEVNIASRKTSYDASGTFGGTPVSADIGDDTSSKLGIKWQVFDDLMLRGTYSESFRAPSITDLFAGGGEGFPQAADPCNTFNYNNATTDQARCGAHGVPTGGTVQNNAQIRSLFGGNPQLQPEFGETRTLGVVYSPRWVEGLDFSLDWYKIELQDVISFRGAQAILNGCYRTDADAALRDLFCSFITRDSTGAILDLRTSQFNLDEGVVEGYDFGVKYRLPETSFGNFGFQWDNTYQVENTLFGTVGEYNGAPTWRLRSNLVTTWQKGDFDAAWTMRYYSGLDEDCPFGANYFEYGITPTELCNNDIFDENGNFLRGENRIGAVTYHDIQVGWKTPWNGKVVVGGRNVFGKEPPITRNSFAHSFDGAYDLPEGGFYYMQYTQKF